MKLKKGYKIVIDITVAKGYRFVKKKRGENKDPNKIIALIGR